MTERYSRVTNIGKNTIIWYFDRTILWYHHSYGTPQLKLVDTALIPYSQVSLLQWHAPIIYNTMGDYSFQPTWQDISSTVAEQQNIQQIRILFLEKIKISACWICMPVFSLFYICYCVHEILENWMNNIQKKEEWLKKTLDSRAYQYEDVRSTILLSTIVFQNPQNDHTRTAPYQLTGTCSPSIVCFITATNIIQHFILDYKTTFW